jgi:hypothetical protein
MVQELEQPTKSQAKVAIRRKMASMEGMAMLPGQLQDGNVLTTGRNVGLELDAVVRVMFFSLYCVQ